MAGPFDDIMGDAPKAQPSVGPFDDIMGEAPEESEQTVIGSIARGAGAGAVNIVQGVSELGASALDAAGVLDDGDQEATTQFFEDTKASLGLTPERTAGRVAEVIVNYGAPGVGVFGWVSKADKARKALQSGTAIRSSRTWFGKSAELFGRTAPKAVTQTRTGRAALTTMGTGVADILVSPSTMSTLADSWDAMPEFLQTEDEGTLTGKELTGVRLRNKLRLGVEGMGFNLAGEIALPVIGATVKGIGGSEMSGFPSMARGLSAGMKYLGTTAAAKMPNAAQFLKKNFTADGLAPAEVMTAVRTAEGMSSAQEDTASKLIVNFDKALKKSILGQRLLGKGKQALQRGYNDSMDYMTGDMPVADYRRVYGKDSVKATDDMRTMLGELSTEFQSTVRASNLPVSRQDELLAEFQNQQGTYIRRLYELHLDPKKFQDVDPTTMPQYEAAREQIIGLVQARNPALDTQSAGQLSTQIIDKVFQRSSTNTFGLTPEAAARQAGAKVAKGAEEIVGKKSLFKLAGGMLKDRSEFIDQAPLLREMMGEVRNPKEAFLRTVDDLSTTMASQRLFDSISRTSKSVDTPGQVQFFDEAIGKMNAGARPFVINGNSMTPDQVKFLTEKLNYTKMGEFDPDNAYGGIYGSLSGNYVPTEIANSLTTPGRSQSFVQDALAVSLQMKGLSQMTKTVLSPVSQVRNFLSNAFVVGANGLLGRNMGLLESGSVLLANAVDDPSQFKLLKAMHDEGTIGQNIQLSEMKKLLQEQTESGVSSLLGQGGNMVRGTPVVGSGVKFMEKTYALGDDFWKILGALGEKGRYGAAMRKGGIDIENVDPVIQQALVNSGLAQRSSSIAGTDFGNMFAADLIKQTMPTYSMVPEAIKTLRRIPVMGNFMAFPAEIVRTSGNILNRAVKEMGFKATPEMVQSMGKAQADAFARQVRGIGAERLSGYVSMAMVVPGATRNAAHNILGITEAEENLLEKNKALWSAGSTMMFLEKPDEDLNADAVDLSYMMPYEFLLAPGRAALEMYQQKGEIGASDAEAIGAGAFAALKKFVEPFASEALAAERVFDVTLRNGKTQTGADVYASGELWGDKLSKSLTHVVGAFVPGIVEQAYTVKGGKIVDGRVNRALTGTPSKYGDMYTAAEEAGTMLTGLRPMKVNIGRSLGYDAGAYAANRTDAVQIFTSVADDNDATVEDIVSAYVRANETRRQHQATMKVQIDAAMDAGMTRGQISQAFKNTGLSRKELRNVLRNRYDPIDVSRALIREVSREVNVKKENRILQRVPKKEINEVRRTLQNSEIIPTKKDAPSAPASTGPFDDIMRGSPQPQPQAATPQPQPSESFVGRATNAISDVASDAITGAGNMLDRARTYAPTVLGSDPAGRAANEEIARRDQSQ